ncbi:MAG: hypothetical protein AAF845_04605 [Bacteroidota bacterium]
MRIAPLVLAVVASLYVAAPRAQTGEPAVPYVPQPRVYLSASDPFQAELPDSFLYMTEAEFAPGRRIHMFQELSEDGRTVFLETVTGLSAEERAAYVDPVAQSRGMNDFVSTDVPVSALPLSEGLTASARSASIHVRTGVGPKDVAVAVYGCDPSRCYTLTVGGPGTEAEEAMQYVPLLSGVAFTD